MVERATLFCLISKSWAILIYCPQTSHASGGVLRRKPLSPLLLTSGWYVDSTTLRLHLHVNFNLMKLSSEYAKLLNGITRVFGLGISIQVLCVVGWCSILMSPYLFVNHYSLRKKWGLESDFILDILWFLPWCARFSSGIRNIKLSGK